MSVSTILTESADLIAEAGLWQSGKPETCAGHCVVTAINKVSANDKEDHDAIAAVFGSLGLEGNRHAIRVAAWNDTEGRTQAEVIEVLHRVALIAADREAALVAEVSA